MSTSRIWLFSCPDLIYRLAVQLVFITGIILYSLLPAWAGTAPGTRLHYFAKTPSGNLAHLRIDLPRSVSLEQVIPETGLSISDSARSRISRLKPDERLFIARWKTPGPDHSASMPYSVKLCFNSPTLFSTLWSGFSHHCEDWELNSPDQEQILPGVGELNLSVSELAFTQFNLPLAGRKAGALPGAEAFFPDSLYEMLFIEATGTDTTTDTPVPTQSLASIDPKQLYDSLMSSAGGGFNDDNHKPFFPGGGNLPEDKLDSMLLSGMQLREIRQDNPQFTEDFAVNDSDTIIITIQPDGSSRYQIMGEQEQVALWQAHMSDVVETLEHWLPGTTLRLQTVAKAYFGESSEMPADLGIIGCSDTDPNSSSGRTFSSRGSSRSKSSSARKRGSSSSGYSQASGSGSSGGGDDGGRFGTICEDCHQFVLMADAPRHRKTCPGAQQLPTSQAAAATPVVSGGDSGAALAQALGIFSAIDIPQPVMPMEIDAGAMVMGLYLDTATQGLEKAAKAFTKKLGSVSPEDRVLFLSELSRYVISPDHPVSARIFQRVMASNNLNEVKEILQYSIRGSNDVKSLTAIKVLLNSLHQVASNLGWQDVLAQSQLPVTLAQKGMGMTVTQRLGNEVDLIKLCGVLTEQILGPLENSSLAQTILTGQLSQVMFSIGMEMPKLTRNQLTKFIAAGKHGLRLDRTPSFRELVEAFQQINLQGEMLYYLLKGKLYETKEVYGENLKPQLMAFLRTVQKVSHSHDENADSMALLLLDVVKEPELFYVYKNPAHPRPVKKLFQKLGLSVSQLAMDLELEIRPDASTTDLVQAWFAAEDDVSWSLVLKHVVSVGKSEEHAWQAMVELNYALRSSDQVAVLQQAPPAAKFPQVSQKGFYGRTFAPGDVQILTEKLRPLASRWKSLGLQLGLLIDKMDVIDLNNPRNGEGALTEVIQAWISGSEDDKIPGFAVTPEALTKAIHSAAGGNNQALAKRLELELKRKEW